MALVAQKYSANILCLCDFFFYFVNIPIYFFLGFSYWSWRKLRWEIGNQLPSTHRNIKRYYLSGRRSFSVFYSPEQRYFLSKTIDYSKTNRTVLARNPNKIDYTIRHWPRVVQVSRTCSWVRLVSVLSIRTGLSGNALVRLRGTIDKMTYGVIPKAYLTNKFTVTRRSGRRFIANITR